MLRKRSSGEDVVYRQTLGVTAQFFMPLLV